MLVASRQLWFWKKLSCDNRLITSSVITCGGKGLLSTNHRGLQIMFSMRIMDIAPFSDLSITVSHLHT